ncbi:MAG: hypothetical protein R3C18_19590 [Planctomycetaceae bacterium]
MVDCPDCKSPVLIKEEGNKLIGVPAAPPVSAATPNDSLQIPAPSGSRITQLVWGGAALVMVLLAIWMFWPKAADTPVVQEEGVVEPAPPEPTGTSNGADEDVVVVEDTHPDQPKKSPAEERLDALYAELLKYTNQHGSYPIGESQNLSWLGELEKSKVGAPAFREERPWNDPVNDAFVRRRVAQFQNPEIPKLVGDDGLPASHFAGVAGVGADAPDLAVQHPRAGIFGRRRQTRLQDVRDGLANTLMIVGVQNQLGSWAAPGNATMRALTKEPYINGPDGLGTGQQDGMFVLLADGSVRFLTSETEPVILRRLAAMADGTPLDPTFPGDPLVMENVQQPGMSPEPVAGPDDVPILVELAPNPPPFNVEKAVAQKLVRFEQTRPLTLRTLLVQWSELSALPIDVSAVPEEALNEQQQHSLENVSLAELLEELIEPAQLAADFSDEFGVRLKPR